MKRDDTDSRAERGETLTTTTTAPEKVHRVPEIAEHLDVEADTVYRMIADGRLRAIRVGRLLRVPASALAAFIDGH